MSADDAAYRDAMIALLPPGAAWPRDPSSRLGLLLFGMAGEPARVDGRVDDLLIEAYPLTTTELITDWERLLALAGSGSIASRRVSAFSALSRFGGQSIGYFVGLAARAGSTITIEEFSSCDIGCDCNAELFGEDWRFAWLVHFHGASNGDVAAAIEAAKPAHTVVTFVQD